MIKEQSDYLTFLEKKERFSMTRKLLPIRRDDKPDSLESYSGDTRRSTYRRVYPRLTFGACARHFMYHSGRGGLVSASHPWLPPRALFLDGGVYGFIIRPIPSARPLIHTRATNTCTPAYDSVRVRGCVRVPPLRIGRVRGPSL